MSCSILKSKWSFLATAGGVLLLSGCGKPPSLEEIHNMRSPDYQVLSACQSLFPRLGSFGSRLNSSGFASTVVPCTERPNTGLVETAVILKDYGKRFRKLNRNMVAMRDLFCREAMRQYKIAGVRRQKWTGRYPVPAAISCTIDFYPSGPDEITPKLMPAASQTAERKNLKMTFSFDF